MNKVGEIDSDYVNIGRNIIIWYKDKYDEVKEMRIWERVFSCWVIWGEGFVEDEIFGSIWMIRRS